MDWKPLDFFKRDHKKKRKSLIGSEHIEHALAASPVPYILATVLVWAVSSVLLLLSENNQRDITIWADGQKAPFAVWARNDFSYTDSVATEALRKQARSKGKYIYRIDPQRSEKIFRNVEAFFKAREKDKNPDYRLRLTKNRLQFNSRLKNLVSHGIVDSRKNVPAGRDLRVVTPDGINYHGMPPDVKICADELVKILELNQEESKKFAGELQKLLADGNLVFDSVSTDADADAAAAKIKPVIKSRKRGDLLVERGQPISGEHLDMLAAEKISLPAGYGLALLGNPLLQSFILLLTALFFLYRTYPEIFRTPRRFSIAGFLMILSLLVNFAAMQFFFYLFRRGILSNYDLLYFSIPIPFSAALISILLGNRTAVFSGFVIASISALMIMPDHAFQLVCRWFAIAALMTLFIRNVSNYRSFFVRVFFCGTLLTAVVNSDIIYSCHQDPESLKWTLFTLLGNSLFCGIASLLAVFVFEMVFNVDTSMSLMVLGDYSHPLLEKLKREAPGTMFHSMTVATLAEDAARAIRANAARAKVGALFHDIGKLKNPGGFVENNVDSSQKYAEMPPSQCCAEICSHVADGLELAREYRLNSFIREAIATHHGDDLISFFYQRALEQNGANKEALNEDDFRYEGEPPVGKELTIISLADACEAASRSLNKPSAEMIEKLVNDIFAHRIRGGQLRNTMLTLAELEIVRKSFISNLTSLNHGRIAYKKDPEK